MMRNRRPSVSLLQRTISILLYSGHCSKIQLLEKLGSNFDHKVVEWRDNLIGKEMVLPRQFQFFYCRKWNPKRYQLIYRCLIRAIMCLSNLLRVIAYPLPIPRLLLCIVYQVFPANHFSQLMVRLSQMHESRGARKVHSKSNTNQDNFFFKGKRSCPRWDSNPRHSCIATKCIITEIQEMNCCETVVDTPHEKEVACGPEWTGFKIVGDNIDKTVRPRHVRLDRQTQSLHYFNSYAVKDRVNRSDTVPDPPSSPNLLSLLPDKEDVSEMKHLFEIHVSRIIVENISFMKLFGDAELFHKEMGTK